MQKVPRGTDVVELLQRALVLEIANETGRLTGPGRMYRGRTRCD